MGSSNTLVFDKCCFCIELKTGCFIIGYLSLISYIILAIATVVLLAVGGALAASGNNSNPAEPHFTIQGKEVNLEPAIGVIVMIASVILLLIVIFLVTFVVVLLVGLHKNKPGHVKAYLIYLTIFLVLSLVHIITVAFSGQGKELAQYIIAFLFNIYFLLVIRSQYIVMKENPAGRGPAIYTS